MKSSYTKIKQTQSLQNLSNLYTARIEDFFFLMFFILQKYNLLI